MANRQKHSTPVRATLIRTDVNSVSVTRWKGQCPERQGHVVRGPLGYEAHHVEAGKKTFAYAPGFAPDQTGPFELAARWAVGGFEVLEGRECLR
jgi:hypothetical protein